MSKQQARHSDPLVPLVTVGRADTQSNRIEKKRVWTGCPYKQKTRKIDQRSSFSLREILILVRQPFNKMVQSIIRLGFFKVSMLEEILLLMFHFNLFKCKITFPIYLHDFLNKNGGRINCFYAGIFC